MTRSRISPAPVLLAAIILTNTATPHPVSAGNSRSAPKLTAEQWVYTQFRRFSGASKMRDATGTVTSLYRLRQKYIEAFIQLDYGIDGITEADRNTFVSELSRRGYANNMRQWHERDKNGDFKVTRRELEIHHHKQVVKLVRIGRTLVVPDEDQIAKALADLIRRDMLQDLNHDGVITLEEASSFHTTQSLTQRHINRAKSQLLPTSFDSNGDGRIERQEYLKIVDRFIESIDGDGDGILSNLEEQAFQQRLKKAETAKREQQAFAARQQREAQKANRRINQLRSCRRPPIPANARIIYVSGSHATSITDIRFKSEKPSATYDQVASLIDLTVEKNSPAIFIIAATSSNVIWRFKGAVQNVKGLWLSSRRQNASGRPLSGVIGLPKARVHFSAQKDCLPVRTRHDKQKQKELVEHLRLVAGRKPSILYVQSRLPMLTLPEVLVDKTPLTSSPDMLIGNSKDTRILTSLATHFGTRNIVSLDKSSILTADQVAIEKALPVNVALAQLLTGGELKVIDRVKVTRLNNAMMVGDINITAPKGSRVEIFYRPKKFLILKKTKLRSDFFKNYKFVLVAGVDTPEITGSKPVTIFSQQKQQDIQISPRSQ